MLEIDLSLITHDELKILTEIAFARCAARKCESLPYSAGSASVRFNSKAETAFAAEQEFVCMTRTAGSRPCKLSESASERSKCEKEVACPSGRQAHFGYAPRSKC